ncbi:MAG: hypothetical protein IKW71_02365 [Elusimicrobiaceae bacterium]|nr:hypothetical protein [Elusimicrobiaceae bacterium]
MKRQTYLILLCGVLLAGCSALQTPSKRDVSATTDFAHPAANHAYYEFTSSPLDRPSVLDDLLPVTAEQPSYELGSDEDFTAENIESSYGTYGDVVVTVASHKFNLGASASRKEMSAFQSALDYAYSVALKQYRPTGFTYAMSSVGVVNPLSDIEVACKLSERSANQVGQATCNTFFSSVSRRYTQLIKGAK